MKKITCVLLSLLLLAGCSAQTKNVKKEEGKTEFSQEVDVVVVGAGGAGMTAAINAYDKGAKVLVIEKMPFAGGNTVRSKGGLNAAETSVQKKLGIKDSVNTFYEDTMKGGKNLNDPEIVKFFTQNSAVAVDWLISIGMDLSDVAMGAGATNARMHRPKDGLDIGPVLVDTLQKNIKSRNIEVIYDTQVTEILSEDNKIIGVKAKNIKNDKDINVKADAVVIATGGFAANEKLYTKYREDIKGFVTTNHPGATGDGIVLAEKLNAALVDMDQIQTNPTVEQKTTEVISESIRGLGAIFVNKEGKRFTSEMLTRDVLSKKILEQEDKFTYIIFDDNLRKNMKAVEGMIKKGIVTEGKDIEDLAKKLSIKESALKETLNKWNEAVKNKKGAEFNRDTGMDNNLSKAPYYAIKVAPGVHHTMGGIKINTNAEVISTDGKVISGLFSAGETTGGIHGANRLGGNAVADIIIFGRQAGIKAAEYGIKNGSLLKPEDKKEVKENLPKIKEGLKGKLKEGVYSAVKKGNNGDVKIEVTVKEGLIQEIKSIENSETGPIFKSVEEKLIPQIIYNQSVELDVVSGASYSSKAVLEAVKEIIEKAK